MITTEDVKDELNNEDLSNEKILRKIKQGQDFIRGYTNNPVLFVEDNPELDSTLLYIVAASLNEDVKGRQGLKTEGIGGVSFNFIDELPRYHKQILARFTRSRTI